MSGRAQVVRPTVDLSALAKATPMDVFLRKDCGITDCEHLIQLFADERMDVEALCLISDEVVSVTACCHFVSTRCEGVARLWGPQEVPRPFFVFAENYTKEESHLEHFCRVHLSLEAWAFC
jgi:hypothetical protein